MDKSLILEKFISEADKIFIFDVDLVTAKINSTLNYAEVELNEGMRKDI